MIRQHQRRLHKDLFVIHFRARNDLENIILVEVVDLRTQDRVYQIDQPVASSLCTFEQLRVIDQFVIYLEIFGLFEIDTVLVIRSLCD